MNRDELEKSRDKLWKDYQSSLVEGHFEGYDFEDYLIYLHDMLLGEWRASLNEIKEWEMRNHPQYRGNKR
tara:strand:+ start:132 stop:341 length:210 start_codon:yes stop_codon:yes gene_type:complete